MIGTYVCMVLLEEKERWLRDCKESGEADRLNEYFDKTNGSRGKNYEVVSTVFLENPNKIEALCNYTLYLHAVQLDYDRARIMYGKMLEYMVGRGQIMPLYYTHTQFLRRAHERLILMTSWIWYIEHGIVNRRLGRTYSTWLRKAFFRQAMVFNPKSAQAHSNYAIVMQFVHQDYAQAEEYYLRACTLDPYDHTITANFNDMLRRLANKPYDGFDAFRLAQAKAAEENANESNGSLSPTSTSLTCSNMRQPQRYKSVTEDLRESPSFGNSREYQNH